MFKPLKQSAAIPAGQRIVGNCGDFAKTAQSMVPHSIIWPCVTDKGVSHVMATDFVWAWDARFSEAVPFSYAIESCK